VVGKKSKLMWDSQRKRRISLKNTVLHPPQSAQGRGRTGEDDGVTGSRKKKDVWSERGGERRINIQYKEEKKDFLPPFSSITITLTVAWSLTALSKLDLSSTRHICRAEKEEGGSGCPPPTRLLQSQTPWKTTAHKPNAPPPRPRWIDYRGKN